MSYIAPNSRVIILSNVPLDNSYTNTIYFGTGAAINQAQYFSLKAKYFLEEHSYQRVGSNVVRVEIPTDSLYDCNYMMFQNTSYSDKWFYAFITDVRYINNAVSEITYEIDVMQTWLPTKDYDLGKWFVVREHSATDAYFENTQPEDLEAGDSLIKTLLNEYDMSDFNYTVLITKYADGSIPNVSIKNNILSSIGVVTGDPNDQTVTNYVQQLVDNGYEDAIISAYMSPTRFHTVNRTDAGANYREDILGLQIGLSEIQGYVPKNKKLFTYPFDTLTFYVDGTYAPTVNALTYPMQYLGINQNKDEGISLNNFPTCAFSGDTFKAWWAQNKGSVISSGVNSVLSSLISGGLSVHGSASKHEYEGQRYLSGLGRMFNGGGSYTSVLGSATARASLNAVTAAVSAAGEIGNFLGKKRDLEHTPPNMHGQITSESLNAGSKRFKFSYYRATIKAEYAARIDDYFTMYGYSTNMVKVPNISSRPYWNYVKTAGAFIFGDLPQDAAKLIADIYDKGITFWKHGDYVGHYEYDNSPT